MKMRTFTLGAIAGASALALAFPLAAQLTSAQSSSASSKPARPVSSQACALALAGRDDAVLANEDAMQTARKAALQARSDALKAAAAITDDAQRQAAVTKADEDFRAAMKTAEAPQSAAMKAAMDAVQSACGGKAGRGGFGFGMGAFRGGPGKMEGRGPNQDMLAQKLGLTTDQLKSELASGKTLQQIAQEHGVQLPMGKGGGWAGHQRSGPAGEASSSN